MRLPLEIMGYGRAERAARARRVLELVELGGFEKKYPWQLSGGMQQRASIARALAFDADILLMDEPFGALDEIVRDRLNEELLALWARTGKTIAFVTHSIPEAVFLSTRIVVMSPRPGRVTDVIESPLPRERPLHIRESRDFLEIAARVRDGLAPGSAMRSEAAVACARGAAGGYRGLRRDLQRLGRWRDPLDATRAAVHPPEDGRAASTASMCWRPAR